LTQPEPLQHDPRTKQQIKDTLYDLLYEPSQRRFQEQLNDIIHRNTIAGGYSHKSFIYREVTYSCDTEPLPRRMNRLMSHLQPDMDAYLSEVKVLNDTELPYVLGFITRVLNSSNELHDYLRVLPDALHRPIKHLIDSCPCRNRKLDDTEVGALQAQGTMAIELMQNRMVTNLLL
jgi:hypothetical protein